MREERGGREGKHGAGVGRIAMGAEQAMVGSVVVGGLCWPLFGPFWQERLTRSEMFCEFK